MPRCCLVSFVSVLVWGSRAADAKQARYGLAGEPPVPSKGTADSSGTVEAIAANLDLKVARKEHYKYILERRLLRL